jgi:hypothetical protein
LTRPNRDVRKPIDQLTAEDLEAFPIWEFATDEEEVEGRDETWVRPVVGQTVELGLWSLSVAAEFRTASGRRLLGFIGVHTANGIELNDGVLLADGNYIFVAAADHGERNDVASALGMTTSDVFPLAFRLRVLISGELALRSGSFP